MSFSIEFAGGAPEGPIFVWGSVEERLEPRQPGPVLAAGGAVEYTRAGAELVIPGIPFGQNRVVVVVARAEPDTSRPIRYYGLSEPFELGPDTNATIGVLLGLVGTPPERPDVDTPGRIVLQRAPWGTEAAESPTQLVVGQEGAVQPEATVIAFDPELGVERGRGRADGQGSFTLSLGETDRLEVAVAAEDGVGERSMGALVRDGVWTATLLGRISGESARNPHRLGILDSDSHPGDPAASGREPEGQPLSILGGSALRVRSARAWRDVSPGTVTPPPRHAHAMAYDSTRGRVVMFGGSRLTHAGPGSLGDTWEWDGARWREVASMAGPRPRAGHAMVYDGARGRVVMFGGVNDLGDAFSETWEFDGRRWSERARGPAPDPRATPAMTFDGGRRRVVLFDSNSETWEWDGESWLRRSIDRPVPGRRTGHALAFDPRRRQVVLFGGRTTEGRKYSQDTWVFDGTGWREVAVEGPLPPPRGAHVLAWDAARGRILLAAGTTEGGELLEDAWEWTGTGWSELAPLPGPRSGAAAVDDGAGRGVTMFGGVVTIRSGGAASLEAVDECVEWDGGRWVAHRVTPNPPPSELAFLSSDSMRGRSVLFLPSGGTWEWDGAAWARASIVPPQMLDASGSVALSYDEQRGRVVLVGRALQSESLGVWEWDGVSWSVRVSESNAPHGRLGEALGFDSARGRLVMFGGADRDRWFSTPWELDELSWVEVMVLGPDARRWPAMTFDRLRREIVLFGGESRDGSSPGGHWSFSGRHWSRGLEGVGPQGRVMPGFVFDDSRGRSILFGGRAAGGARLGDTWELEGDNWSMESVSESPRSRFGHGLTYDGARRAVLLFGGSIGDAVGDDHTWVLPSRSPESRASAVFSVDWSSSGITSSEVTGLGFRARAGGAGYSAEDTREPGFEALGWDASEGVWQLLGRASADVTAPGWIEHSTSSELDARRLMLERDGRILVKLRTESQRSSLEPSELQLEYVELALRYRNDGRDVQPPARPDSGIMGDAGRPDGGVSFDSGSQTHDAAGLDGSQLPDAGIADAANPDAMNADAMSADAMSPDMGGPSDGAPLHDAMSQDSGGSDAAPMDSGSDPDSGAADSGDVDGGIPACRVCSSGPCECDRTFMCDFACESCDPECGCCVPSD